jgi:hypothetical protein
MLQTIHWPLAAAVNRRTCGAALAVLGSASLVFACFQLAPSFSLSGHRSSDALTFELRDLALGAYRSFDGRHSRLYVVRMPSDEVSAFTVPLRAAKVAMPDTRWGRSAFDCADFRPGVNDDRLTPDSVFRCRDADLPAWGVYQWRWRLDGRSAAQLPYTHIDNMPRATVERSGAMIRVHGWDNQW